MTNTEPITEAPPNPLKRHSTEDVVVDKRLKLLTDINTDTSSKSVAAASVLRASPHSKQLHRFRSLSEILRQLISSALHSSVDHVLKALAASVMTKAFNTCSTLESDADEISCNGNKNSATTSSLYEYRAAEMAREKAAECIRLQRELSESKQSNEELTCTISSLRCSVQTLQTQVHSTNAALRLAATQAANAQSEADKWQSRMDTVLHEVQKLKQQVSCIQESTARVRDEHEVLSNACRQVRAELMQCEAECMQGKQRIVKYEQRLEVISEKCDKEEENASMLRSQLESTKYALQAAVIQVGENKSLEQTRVDRIHNLEGALREQKVLLVQATQSACEQESAVSALKESLAQVKAEAVRSQNSLQQMRVCIQEEREVLADQLEMVRKEKQALENKCEEWKEKAESKQIQWDSQEKHVEQLQKRINQLVQQQQQQEKDAFNSTKKIGSVENRVSAAVSPTTPSTSTTPSVIGCKTGSLPPLLKSPMLTKPKKNTFMTDQQGSKNSSSRSNNGCCSICGETPYGLMKSCPCGKVDCALRAHINCMNSHRKQIQQKQSDDEMSKNYTLC